MRGNAFPQCELLDRTDFEVRPGFQERPRASRRFDTAMPHWLPVANLADCPPGRSLEVVVAGRIVALFNVDGTLQALDGVCPHQGGPLGKGTLRGAIVTCPWHGWQFDVRSGQHQLSATICQPRFPVRVDGEVILVEIDEEPAD